ncbi:Bug family tripartite tricarboxylate transporter substrate binding protein [Halorussus halophilus]|uniref:Bug family tripartite tricarboxylate transporter substrate binding protein n=1 Tax=Halorussus halophilus TaxID=2650975 RepID=UPI001CE428C1|nr:tripartite tricarboxylate transporter substrate binding protein [Halorussus halophilus]
MSGKPNRREFLKYAGTASAATTFGLTGYARGQETTTESGEETTEGGQETTFTPVDQNYPESGQTITYIVPFSEGGGTDTYARQIMPVAAEELGGVNVQISNVPGGASLRGTGRIVNAEGDGYTMGAFNPPSTPLSYLVFEPNYDLTNVEGICSYARTPYVIIANADANVENMDDLIGRYESGEFQAFGGCQARGGLNHVASLVMKNQYGMQWQNYVGYDGCAPAAQAVASGEIPASIGSDLAVEGTVNSGRANVVAVLMSGGSGVFPDVAPVTEQGYENIDYIGGLNRCMWFPPGTDEGKVNRMANAVQAATQSEQVQQWSEESGNLVEFNGPEYANQLLQDTLEILPEQVDIEQIREEATG